MRMFELICPHCGGREVVRGPEMLARVQSAGMLRRAANPELELLVELFLGSLPRQTCHQCGQPGVTAAAHVEDDWEDERLCRECGRRIPEARLRALPGTKRCIHCADDF